MILALAAVLGGCSGSTGAGPGTGVQDTDPNGIAARVNGKDIRMEEVEKAVKAQAQGEETRMSPLELASARLSVLQQLIQTEVMYQKAEKEQVLPSDEDVNVEVNKRKTASGMSAEEFDRKMKEAGETEQSWRLNIKKELALAKLQEKIAGRVEAPKDSEIEAFYNGNKEQFKNKRGAELAAIVIDPTNSGQGDTTINQETANIKAKEVGEKALSGRFDFATLAQESSEDLQTRSNRGDWRYFSEDEMKQTFPQGFAEAIMGPNMENGKIFPQAIPLEGKILIIKLQRKQEIDEDLTLESPNVRQRVTEMLINARKSLLWQSYIATAINEAKVENYLAKNVVDNPNELSGARPAGAANVNAANTATPTTSPAGSNTNTSTATNEANTTKPTAPAANRPAAANAARSATGNTNAAAPNR